MSAACLISCAACRTIGLELKGSSPWGGSCLVRCFVDSSASILYPLRSYDAWDCEGAGVNVSCCDRQAPENCAHSRFLSTSFRFSTRPRVSQGEIKTKVACQQFCACMGPWRAFVLVLRFRANPKNINDAFSFFLPRGPAAEKTNRSASIV